MPKNLKQTIIIGLLAANLIMMIVLFNTTKNTLKHMSSDISNLRQDMYHTQQQTIDRMANRFETILLDEQNKVENFTTKITKITPNEQSAVMELDFEVREVNKPDQLFVLYKTDEETNWSELEAVRADPLTYHAVFTADLNKNYEFRIIEGLPSGASTQLNTRELRKNLYEEYFVWRTLVNSSGRSEDSDAITFDFTLQNNTFGLEEYHIQSVAAKIIYENNVLFDQDVTHLNRGNPDEIARRNLQIASGQPVEKIPKASLEQDPNMQHMSFLIELIKEDLRNDFPDLFTSESNGFLEKKETDFQIEVHVVYHNGEEKQLGL